MESPTTPDSCSEVTNPTMDDALSQSSEAGSQSSDTSGVVYTLL